MPSHRLAKLNEAGFRMPVSACAVDVWGEDVLDSDLVLASGDADGTCVPTGRAPISMTWLEGTPLFVPVWMTQDDGTPVPVDARHVLAGIAEAFTARGLTPVVATELEFFLYRLQCDGLPTPAASDGQTGFPSDKILSVDELELFAPVLDEVYVACTAANIPVDSATSEAGPGQFEVNFNHVADPLKAADDAALFKKILRGVARARGFGASFMAKPYGDRSGSGLHVHFSLIDSDGRNVFDDGTDRGSDLLLHVVQGLMATMRENTLIWAPHANSFRRLTPGAHAPCAVSWGYENRTSAIRIPGGDPLARRIEHRVAGADANPYLVLSAILGGALKGIEAAQMPPAAVVGNAYEQNLPQLAAGWAAAVDLFETSDLGIFSDTLRRALAQTKGQEIDRFLTDISTFEYQTYLAVV